MRPILASSAVVEPVFVMLGLVLVLNALIAVVRRWREEAQGSTPLLTGSLSA